MNRNISRITGWTLDVAALLCVVFMFLAGNDVWHDTGRPDFWHADQPPFFDVRIFVIAYYVLAGLVLVRIGSRLTHIRRVE